MRFLDIFKQDAAANSPNEKNNCHNLKPKWFPCDEEKLIRNEIAS